MAARKVLVTGASGYIGGAVLRSFASSGWTTYGLVRRDEAAKEVSASGATPVVADVVDATWVDRLLLHTSTVDVIVSVTEDRSNYLNHFDAVISTIRRLATVSNQNGVRPLVLFTSGCKDYGRTALDGTPNLRPSLEGDELLPPPAIRDRCVNAPKILNHADLFDAALLRPVTVYGGSSSYYSSAFTRAREAQQGDGILIVPSHPNSIAHGCHVDDCGDAYVALAKPEIRSQVAGQIFNISGRRYETAQQIAEALKEEYGLRQIRYVPEPGTEDTKLENMLFAFSQWVGDEKIRGLTGWGDYRPLFSEGIKGYREEYEAEEAKKSYAVGKMNELMAWAKGQK